MKQAFRTVSSGFKLVYIGLLLVVLAVVGGMIAVMVVAGGAANAQNPAAAAGKLQAVVLGIAGLAILGNIVGLIGRFQCMAVPAKLADAKQMIVISVALEVTSLVISLVKAADDFQNFLPASAKLAAGYGPSLMSIVAAILFLLYTRSVAEFIRRRDLADKAMSVLWTWVTVVILMIVGVVVILVAVGGAVAAGQQGQRGQGAAAGMAGGGACIASILVLGAGILGLVNLVRYANLLIGMSGATMSYSRRAPAYDSGYDDDDDDWDDDEYDRPRRRKSRRRRRDDDDDDDDDY